MDDEGEGEGWMPPGCLVFGAVALVAVLAARLVLLIWG
jgi:hypothetical protein